MKYIEIPPSGDPSDIIQNFMKIRLNIHCCRYWWLKHWKHQSLSFPFWRFYWNMNEGGFVCYGKKVMLNPNSIILIPPNTPFSTDIIGDSSVSSKNNMLEGGWISDIEIESDSLQNGFILHFFIHFNLGFPFDNVVPDIYIFNITEEQRLIIQRITDILKHGGSDFDFNESLDLYTLILSSISFLSNNIWRHQSIEPKILDVMSYINRNLRKNLTNEILASTIKMSTNAFARLFKQQTGNSPQKYLTNTRIENACNLLHHSSLSINEIADLCGFADRYYFTKVFKSSILLPPAQYRKQVLLKKY